MGKSEKGVNSDGRNAAQIKKKPRKEKMENSMEAVEDVEGTIPPASVSCDRSPAKEKFAEGPLVWAVYVV